MCIKILYTIVTIHYLSCSFVFICVCLGAGTPYYVAIGVVNELGQGGDVSVIAFTGTTGMYMSHPGF